jgi:hypothetical protein
VPFPVREFRVFMDMCKPMLINDLRWHTVCVQKVSTEAAWGNLKSVDLPFSEPELVPILEPPEF